MTTKSNSSQIKRNNYRRSLAAAFLFTAIFSLSYIWQAIIPVGSEAPDEGQHIQMVYFLKSHKRIPVFDQEKDIFSTFFFNNGFFSSVYYSMAYNSPLSYLPYVPFAGSNIDSGGKTVVLPLRLVSGLFISFFSLFLFLSLYNFSGQKLFSALGLTLFISLIPQLVFTSAYVNIDPIALFLSALSLYFLSIIFSQAKQQNYLFFGIALGFLALCKANYLIIVLYLGLIALWQLSRATKSSRQKIINFVLVAAPILVLNLGWWIRNFKFFRDPIIINHILSSVKTNSPDWFITPAESGVNYFNIFHYNSFNNYVFDGFYAYLGSVRILLPSIFYWTFYVALIVLALIGLWFTIRKSRPDLLLTLFSLFIIFLDFIIFIRKNLVDFSPQGRHLFPLLIPIAVILILTLKNWPGKIQKYLLSSMIIASIFANVYALTYLIRGYFVTGTAWATTTDWANRIGSVFTFNTDPVNKLVPDFTFDNLTSSNYALIYSAIYADNPAYSIYFSALFAILLMASVIIILRILILARNES